MKLLLSKWGFFGPSDHNASHGFSGLGHQVATDYIDVMLKASKKYGIKLVDKQLAAAPLRVKKVGITGQRCSAQRILLGLTGK